MGKEEQYFDFKKYPSNEETADYVKTLIKRLRIDRNFSQEDIAHYVGKSRSTIQAWERTDKSTGPIIKPDYHDLMVLIDLYKIPPTRLFGKFSNEPAAQYGHLIVKKTLPLVHGRSIRFEWNDETLDGIVDDKNKKIITLDQEILYTELPNDFIASLLASVPKQELLYRVPYRKSEISALSQMKIPVHVWVKFIAPSRSIANGNYTLTSKYATSDHYDYTLDYEQYGKLWEAYPEKPYLFLESKKC